MNAFHGIPTTFCGILMRSRTEACWAAMFNRLLWGWEYEPPEQHGWIPDFGLKFHQPTMVEVKADSQLHDLERYLPKIERSGWGGEALVLLGAPIDIEAGSPIIGLIAEREAIVRGRSEWLWSPARAFHCLSCGETSVLAEDFSWRCRKCGVDGGNSHVGSLEGGLQHEWAAAKNLVQWRPGT